MNDYISYDTYIVRISDGAIIPRDDDNYNYKDYLDTLGAGPEDILPDPVYPIINISNSVLIGDGVDFVLVSIGSGPKNTTENITVTVGSNPPMEIPMVFDEFGNGQHEYSCVTSPTKIIFAFYDSYAEVRAL